MLNSRGVFINRCFDELTLAAPAMIAENHREYAAVGAEFSGPTPLAQITLDWLGSAWPTRP
jgi:hypothetical protein